MRIPFNHVTNPKMKKKMPIMVMEMM